MSVQNIMYKWAALQKNILGFAIKTDGDNDGDDGLGGDVRERDS